MSHPYDYRVRSVRRVVDGDTVDLELDLGLYLSATIRVRLLGVDTPDGTDVVEAPAREYVEEWFEDRFRAGVEVRCATHRADSFGRWLGDVYAVDDHGRDGLSRALLAAGLAVLYRRS